MIDCARIVFQIAKIFVLFLVKCGHRCGKTNNEDKGINQDQCADSERAVTKQVLKLIGNL